MKLKLIGIVCLALPLFCFASGGKAVPLEHANVDLHDHASLQRGAKLYVNYCSGCHSLKYMRYNRMAKDIGIVEPDGKVADNLVKENLIFTGAAIFDTMHGSMPGQDAAKWFGVTPPDLSLIGRVRGADWLYTYLLGFYRDDKKQWGTNNIVFPDVAMPNVLQHLQGIQVPQYKTDHDGSKKIAHLELVRMGDWDTLTFRSRVNDIVNFLVYVGEPIQLKRQQIGFWVLAFLAIFIVLTYLLKQEYWKDVK